MLRGAAEQRMTLHELGDRYIEEILRQTGGNKMRAAEILGINANTPVQYVTAINRAPGGEAIELGRGCWPMTSVEFVFTDADKPRG